MVMKIEEHAYKVVEGFKKSLTNKQCEAIGAEGFEELQILIEAALGGAISKSLHDSAKRLENLSKEMRHHAGHIEELEE
ncbi:MULTISPECIES: hypothetical protein [Thiomicrorhabdus]|uniref:Phosphatase n=1 Tax=Thiomicrorhabdus heinhorstiae TaxID=2748010 RepID=A0ABS0BVE4_9GAMM|nr:MULTISPECIES: hypothetical protein [Thiomicrorhabdus]MBF6057807.1 hypothetical protein [Thiomicrorhabdus heinhorstiae]